MQIRVGFCFLAAGFSFCFSSVFPLFVPRYLPRCQSRMWRIFAGFLFKGDLFSTKLHSFSLLLLTDQKGFLNTCRVANKGCGIFVLALLTDQKGFLNTCRVANKGCGIFVLAFIQGRPLLCQQNYIVFLCSYQQIKRVFWILAALPIKDATNFSWRLFKGGIYSRNYIRKGAWLMNFSGKDLQETR